MQKNTTLRKIIILPALALTLLGGGALAGYAGMASAADGTSTSPATTSQSIGEKLGDMFDTHMGGHIGKNGVKEALLTGDDAVKATASAQAAVADATVDRVENDAEGAVYEAHMTKSDGSHVTVKMDKDFGVTATEDGFGGGKK